MDNSGSAFPLHNTHAPMCDKEGITKRQWFAGMALSGYLSNESVINTWAKNKEDEKIIAKIMFLFADAMLAESAKKPSE